MSENNDSQNVDGAGKVQPGDPVATTEVTQRSDKRMAILAKSYTLDAERYKSDAGKPEKEIPKPTPQSPEPKVPEVKAGEIQPKAPEPVKPKEEPKLPEKKAEEPPKKEQPAKKPTLESLESERKAHQARADKAEAELAKERESATTWQTERAELLKSKELVDQFNSDPVKFVNERLPELGKKLAVAGDPIKMIESEVGEFYTELEKKFKTDLGEDWRYSEAESMKPGTPSFRFRLAITARTQEAQQKASEYVGAQKRQMEEAQRRTILDKAELKAEYGFTDEHFKRADEILQKEGISYKNLVRLALIDEIIKQKISALPPVHEPSPDLTQTRGASSESLESEKKPELSKEGKRMASRLAFSRSL
jgi:hypothetical protein